MPAYIADYFTRKNLENSLKTTKKIICWKTSWKRVVSRYNIFKNSKFRVQTFKNIQNSEFVKPCYEQLCHFKTFQRIFKCRLILVPTLKTPLGLKRKLSWLWLSTKEGILRLETLTRVRWVVEFLSWGYKTGLILDLKKE